MEKEKRKKMDPLVLYTIFPQSWSFPVLLDQYICSSLVVPAVLLGKWSAVLILRCLCLVGDAPTPSQVLGST